MNRRVLLVVVLMLLPIAGRADRSAYRDTDEVTVTKGTLTFRHVHNWDSPKIFDLFLALTDHERFFSAANDFAFVELRDGDRVLFRSPSPALTHLWISPDSQFFVGISRIMLNNPYQLVVWQLDGTVVHREHISAEVAKVSLEHRRQFAERFPKAEQFLSSRYFIHNNSTYLDYEVGGIINYIGHDAWDFLFPLRVPHPYSNDFAESVTNWIEWFNPESPDFDIPRKGTELTLSLRSPTGKRVNVRIKTDR